MLIFSKCDKKHINNITSFSQRPHLKFYCTGIKNSVTIITLLCSTINMPEVLGKQVGPVAYGLMGFTWRPNATPLDQAIEAMRTASNNGCTLWSGAEFYGTPEYNSMTLLKAYFTKYPEDADKITIAMKGAYNLEKFQLDGSPENIRRSIDNVINQLGGTKKLDLFAPSRRDHKVPFEETLSVIQKEYVDTGKVGGIALSECSAETIEEAVKIAKISLVEVELSLFSTDILHNGVAAACAKHNIPIMAYSPIGRGVSASIYFI
jgi:pyridoxine 4-dehydrogenase